MNCFLSCDWGTSTFRLRLVEISSLAFDSIENDHGIAKIYEQWKQTGKKESERFDFYRSFIADNIKRLQQKTGRSLQDLPLIISGMASSSIGMSEISYQELPMTMDGADIKVRKEKASQDFLHDLLLISGIRTDDDVARGEETQLIGCDISDETEQLFIFPGTHSKHIVVKQNKATDIKTYMTGEFFELLTRKSILASAVEEAELHDPTHQKSFETGIKDSVKFNLLNRSFLVRTNHLFDKITKQENYTYLSGLLIGHELKELKGTSYSKITLVANDPIAGYYVTALRELAVPISGIQNAEMALIKGQLRVLEEQVKQ